MPKTEKSLQQHHSRQKCLVVLNVTRKSVLRAATTIATYKILAQKFRKITRTG